MAAAVGILIVVIAVAVSIWLAYTALTQVRQLRGELDQTQTHLNQTRQVLEDTRQDLQVTRQELRQVRQELDELKATARKELDELKGSAALPPPLPKARSTGLEDLREQLRAAHREETPDQAPTDE